MPFPLHSNVVVDLNMQPAVTPRAMSRCSSLRATGLGSAAVLGPASLLLLFVVSAGAQGQRQTAEPGLNSSSSLPDAPSAVATGKAPSSVSSSFDGHAEDPPQQGTQPAPANLVVQPAFPPGPLSLSAKFQYYLREEASPGTIIGPAFSAAFRLASPKGTYPTKYPPEWRQGAAAYGRNYGDSIAQSTTERTAKFAVGALLREDPRYFKSTSTSYVRRSYDAILFTVLDQSDSGKRRFAIANFAGAAAGGFVGNAYLPPGYRSSAHAEQRAVSALVSFAGQNIAHEFDPEIKAVVKKLHVPFIR